ncbi:MAG: UDP-N-acetylmuramate dehydrogenase [Oscillospiraceae bacterium]|nr:UDP-N-acetylmuramate dehydrogenase [Oscillospiraceae bacterium]
MGVGFINGRSLAGIKSVCGGYGAAFLPNEKIAPYTTFKIGGGCNIVKVNGVGVLRDVLLYCGENGVPYHILGRGSNALVSDKGLSGAVLLIGSDFSDISVNGVLVECQAGAALSDICEAAAKHSLAGLEFAYGIPGSAGGAVYMNAGAFGGEMKDVVQSCAYLDENRAEREIGVAEAAMSYRQSVFSEKDWVITKIRFKLERGDKADIKGKMGGIAARRREKQPLEYPSAGSAFKRPSGNFAAKLIDECGLRGFSSGGAQVSEKHCGFVINKNNATFGDVTGLIEKVRDMVYARTGIALECEIKIFE